MRRTFVALAIALGAIAPGTVASGIACAGEGGRAVLVVDTGESELFYCVALPDESVSGLELIELAGEQHGLQYRFGYGGQAVCELAGVGPEGDDCFDDYPDFWGYWRGDGSGGWSWSSTGAGSTEVEDGDVEGWSWGSGQDGNTHPQPPPTEFGSVCPQEKTGKPEAQPKTRHSESKNQRSAGVSAVSKPADSSEANAKPGSRQPKPSRPRERDKGSGSVSAPATPGPSPTEIADVATGATDEIDDAPPVAGLVGLAISAALVIGGRAMAKRRTD